MLTTIDKERITACARNLALRDFEAFATRCGEMNTVLGYQVEWHLQHDLGNSPDLPAWVLLICQVPAGNVTMKHANPQTIREFLALPAVALPSAIPADRVDIDDGLDPYVALRHPTDWIGGNVIIRADRDGWRDGFLVLEVDHNG